MRLFFFLCVCFGCFFLGGGMRDWRVWVKPSMYPFPPNPTRPDTHKKLTSHTNRETARLASRLLDTLKRINPLESAVADARFLQPVAPGSGGGGGVHEALRGRIQAIYQVCWGVIWVWCFGGLGGWKDGECISGDDRTPPTHKKNQKKTKQQQAAGSGGGGGRHVRFPGTMPVNLCRKDVAALQQVNIRLLFGVGGAYIYIGCIYVYIFFFKNIFLLFCSQIPQNTTTPTSQQKQGSYWLAEKTDGVRYLLFTLATGEQPASYLMDRSLAVASFPGAEGACVGFEYLL